MRNRHVLIMLTSAVLSGCATLGQRLSSEDANIYSRAVVEFKASSQAVKERTVRELIKSLTKKEYIGDGFYEYIYKENCSAAGALGKIGIEAKSAIPELMKATGRFSIEECAAQGLGKISPAYISALADAGLKRGYHAMHLIFSKMDASAVPDLIIALSNPDVAVRKIAAEGLGIIGIGAKSAVPELIKTLSDPDSIVRAHAATALGNIGSEGQNAVPELTKALSNSDVGVRVEAAKALCKMGPVAKTAIPELLTALGDSDYDVRGAAAESLNKMRPLTTSAIPELVKALSSSHYLVRELASKALKEIGPTGVKALSNGEQTEAVRIARLRSIVERSNADTFDYVCKENSWPPHMYHYVGGGSVVGGFSIGGSLGEIPKLDGCVRADKPGYGEYDMFCCP